MAMGTTAIFRGWWVVLAVFVVLMTTAGLGFYNAGVILNAAVDELDLSVGLVSLGTALFFGVSGLSGFALARYMDTADIRWFFVAGGIIGSVALAGLRYVEGPVTLFVFFALFGFAFALAGLVPCTTVVARWFTVRRSVALSVASTGLSVGGIVITRLSTAWIGEWGLRGAALPMAALWVAGIVPISWLLIRSTPGELGLEPDGDPSTASADGRPRQLPGATFAEGSGTRFFAGLCAAYAMIMLAQVGGINHLFNLTAERVDTATAATALATLALSSVVGRLVGGVVVMRIAPLAMAKTLAAVQGLALLGVGSATSDVAILGFAALFGVSVGNLLMLQPLLIADAFGVASYSRLYSTSQLVATIGVAGGPAVLGLVHDASSYLTAFAVAAGANAVGIVLLWLAGPLTAARESWERPAAAVPV